MSTFLNSVFFHKKNSNMNCLMPCLNKFMLSKKNKEDIIASSTSVIDIDTDYMAPIVTPDKIEEVVTPDPPIELEKTSSKEEWIDPRNKDTLFWCIFIIIHGYDEYLQVGRNYGIKELEIKKQISDHLIVNQGSMKNTNNKITKGYVQEILSELLTSQKDTSTLAMIAMTVYYQINLIIMDSSEKYLLEFVSNKDVTLPTYLLHKDSYGKYKVRAEPLSLDAIKDLKETKLCLESYMRPLKSISNYKTEELESIAKKIGIYDNNKKYKKQLLYEEITEASRWR